MTRITGPGACCLHNKSKQWACGQEESRQKRLTGVREHSHADRKGRLILPWMLLIATTWPWRLLIMAGRSAVGRGQRSPSLTWRGFETSRLGQALPRMPGEAHLWNVAPGVSPSQLWELGGDPRGLGARGQETRRDSQS